MNYYELINCGNEPRNGHRQGKNLLTTSRVLVHYNPDLPIKMAADASAYGIAAVVSHVFPDGREKPITFASRTLSPSEKKYAQIEKEALALIFGGRKFHQYLYGRRFTLVTDHRPLTTILGPKKGIPPIAAARIQRWAVQLSAYLYDIEFKPTKEHSNADALSRLPLLDSTESSVSNVNQIQSLPVDSGDVENASRRDPLISKVLLYTREVWPAQVSDSLGPFYTLRYELTAEGNCLLWGTRIVIPSCLRELLLKELHQGHPGMSRMKALARNYLWWPNLDKDIEHVAGSCSSCQTIRQAPPRAPMHPGPGLYSRGREFM